MPGCLAVHFSHVVFHLLIVAFELWKQRHKDGGFRAKNMVAYTTLLFHFFTIINLGVARALYADDFVPRAIQFAAGGFVCSQVLLIQTVVIKPPAAVVAACAIFTVLLLIASAFAYEFTNVAAKEQSTSWEYAMIGFLVGPFPSAVATYVATQNELASRNMFVILRKQELITTGTSRLLPPGRNPPLATENLLENAGGVLHQCSLGAVPCCTYLR